MRVFEKVCAHEDDRRTLEAFSPSAGFPVSVEVKIIRTSCEGVRLGNHSHPHREGFFLVVGHCRVRTWKEGDESVQEHTLVAPVMFEFDPREEHLLTCSSNMILIGFSPTIFDEGNNIPATRL
jgi:hypothetical protein